MASCHCCWSSSSVFASETYSSSHWLWSYLPNGASPRCREVPGVGQAPRGKGSRGNRYPVPICPGRRKPCPSHRCSWPCRCSSCSSGANCGIPSLPRASGGRSRFSASVCHRRSGSIRWNGRAGAGHLVGQLLDGGGQVLVRFGKTVHQRIHLLGVAVRGEQAEGHRVQNVPHPVEQRTAICVNSSPERIFFSMPFTASRMESIRELTI